MLPCPPRRAAWLLLAACLGLTPVASAAGDGTAAGDEEEQIDPLSLAALLLRDGHYDRAQAVLAEVDQQSEGLDRAKFHMLVGLTALKSGRYEDATVFLERSIQAGQTDPMARVFLAQARFGSQDLAGTIQALDEAGEAAHKLAGSFLIEAQCHWRLGQRVSAWIALTEGLARHPQVRQMARHRVLLLVDMGLFLQARDEGTDLLAQPDTKAADHVAIAEALRRAKQLDQAVAVLERAALEFPDDEAVAIQLGHTYLDQGRPLTAALIFDRLSRRNPKYAVEAAELYRRAGKPLRALAVNARVAEQSEKIRQRLGLLVDLERFEQAAALHPRLSRLGLLADDAIRYALAYAYYRTSRFGQAEQILGPIQDADLFRQANELRRAMEACRQRGWACE